MRDTVNIAVYVNNRCNMRCPYCYDGRKRTGREFDPGLMPDLFRFCGRMRDEGGPLRVSFVGGEPSLSLSTLAALMAGMPEDCGLNIMTNAWVWPEGFLDVIGRYKDRLQIITSYDGVFQDRRKQGSGERVRSNIRILLDRGFNVTPCWTLFSEDAPRLFENALHMLGVHRNLFLKRNCSHGMWGGNRAYVDGLRDNLERLVDLCAIRTVSEGANITLPNRIDRGMSPLLMHRQGTFSCHDYVLHTLTVDIDGKIYPCERYVTDGRHALGDIVNGFSKEGFEGPYRGAGPMDTICPYLNEVTNGDPLDAAGCLNKPADSLLYAARAKYQDRLDRLYRLRCFHGTGQGEGRA